MLIAAEAPPRFCPTDPNRYHVYLAESIVWRACTKNKAWFMDLISFEDFSSYVEELFADAMRRPYRYQHRRRRKSAGPISVIQTNQENASAYRQSQRISVGAASLMRWIAIHEVAHLLTEHSTEGHGWEFISVYTQMIARRGETETAEQLAVMAQCVGAELGGRVSRRRSVRGV